MNLVMEESGKKSFLTLPKPMPDRTSKPTMLAMVRKRKQTAFSNTRRKVPKKPPA